MATEKRQFTASQGRKRCHLWEQSAVLVEHYNDRHVSDFLAFNQYNQDADKASAGRFKVQRDWEAFWWSQQRMDFDT